MTRSRSPGFRFRAYTTVQFWGATSLIKVGDRLKAHLQTGNYPVEPDLKEEACRYCDYDIACRKRSPIK